MKRLPNILTISRIFLTMGFVFCLSQPGVGPVVLALVLFVLASLTDFYDGYYAKKHNLVSNFGKIMDPIADKFLILAAFFVFALMGLVPLWMFYIIFVREVFVTGTRLVAVRKGEFLAAEKAGKLKTVSQITVILFILCFLLLQQSGLVHRASGSLFGILLAGIYGLMLATVIITVLSGVSYLWNNRKILLPDVGF